MARVRAAIRMRRGVEVHYLCSRELMHYGGLTRRDLDADGRAFGSIGSTDVDRVGARRMHRHAFESIESPACLAANVHIGSVAEWLEGGNRRGTDVSQCLGRHSAEE